MNTEDKISLAKQLAGLSKQDREDVDLLAAEFPAPAKKGPKPGKAGKKAAKKVVKKRRKRRTREQIEADEAAAAGNRIEDLANQALEG